MEKCILKLTLKSSAERNADIILEEYFHLKAVFSDKIEYPAHIGFYCSGADLLEFTADRYSGEIRSAVLTLCRHFIVINDDLCLNNVSAINTAAIDLPTRIECDYFSAHVYNNGVYVKLSAQEPANRIVCGNTAFMLSESMNLVGFAVTGMTAAEINHCITELQYMQ